MSNEIIANEARLQVVNLLAANGYSPRDADPTDFAHPGTNKRFKVGTTRGEVTVTVWLDSKRVSTMRAISFSTLDTLLEEIGVWTL